MCREEKVQKLQKACQELIVKEPSESGQRLKMTLT